MTLNEALDILQKEFPEKYIQIKVKITQHVPYKGTPQPREIVWEFYVDGYPALSPDSPNLEKAIEAFKIINKIDQPKSEDVEVTV